MSTSLARMLDLALGTPEVGAVNFNILHTLLHAVLEKLELSQFEADLNEEDQEILKHQPESAGDDTKGLDQADSKSKENVENELNKSDRVESKTKRLQSPLIRPKSPYHELEKKVSSLEQQMSALNSLPSNEELFERSKTKSETEKSRPVNDMWQSMQLQKKVNTNEEGIDKLMSLTQDMMSEMHNLKEQNDDLKQKLQDAANATELLDKLKGIEDENARQRDELLEKLKQLQDLTNALNERLNQYPDPSVYDDFVTWSGLEDSLKGIRLELQPKERVVMESSIQTEPISRPPSRPPSSLGPSAELQEVLERIGKLTDLHDLIEERVTTLEEEMKTKADKASLELLGIPDSLLQDLKGLQDQMDAMNKAKSKDSEALARMQQTVVQMQSELERLSNTAQQLLENSLDKQKHIDALYSTCNKLDDNKADKDFVQSEVEVKADKRHLDGKVNRSLFDTTCDELNKMIDDVLNKLVGHEEEWKKAQSQLSSELDGKLDRLEFGPIREELERQLRALSKKLLQLDRLSDMNEDAAGLRKQLTQRFNCISCDRPVEMMPHGPIPSIPASQGMPATRSVRPYTTFELEQIRQHAKSLNQGQVDVSDLYGSARACGGNHTLTYPNRRITRMTHVNNLFREDEVMTPQTTQRPEADIQGADGHVYKGRFDDRLPELPVTGQGVTQPKSPSRRSQTTVGYPTRPISARSSGRPMSGRIQRPSSSRPSSRAESAGGRVQNTTEVPTGMRDVTSPPPPPTCSETSKRDTQ